MNNNNLNFAKKMKDDEYYTRRFLADLIFKKTVEIGGVNKVLYVLAADGDNSYFTKYAKSHQLHYVNNIDLYNATNFIYDGGKTVIITNPPFSLLSDGLKKVQRNVEYDRLQLCLIIPIITISTASLQGYLQHCYFYQFNSKMNEFFHNFELKSVNTILMTTFKLHDGPVSPKSPSVPEGERFTTPVTHIIHKQFYEACGYQLVGADPSRNNNLFKRFLGKKRHGN